MKFGNNGNYCVKTLKRLNKISEDGRLTRSLTLLGLGDVLNIPFPELHSGLFVLNPFRIWRESRS